MLSVEDAVALLASRLSVVEGSESVALVLSDGRVLAQDLMATLQLAAVHQFRRRRLCACAARTCRVGEREGLSPSPTGCRPAPPPSVPRRRAEAIRIFTGAPMPAGADTVFMQEDVRVDETGRSSCRPA